MSTLTLADALPDFGASKTPKDTSSEVVLSSLRPDAAQLSVREEESQQQAIHEAVTQAEAALAERLGREHAELLAAEQARSAEELEAGLRQARDEAAAMIATRFDELEREVVSQVSASAARILGTFLTGELQARAVDELTRVVQGAIKDQDALRVRVRGAASLHDSLKAKLGEHAQRLEFSEAPGFDLTVEVGESVFETRLAEWSDALEEVFS